MAARLSDTIVVRRGRVKELRNGTTRETPELRKPVSAGEINRELATLRRMFTLVKKAGKLHHIPYVERLREDDVRKGFFERKQFESVRHTSRRRCGPGGRRAALPVCRVASCMISDGPPSGTWSAPACHAPQRWRWWGIHQEILVTGAGIGAPSFQQLFNTGGGTRA